MRTNKVSQLLCAVKERTEPLPTAGVYLILCSCGTVYLGDTQRSISTRPPEHVRHCHVLRLPRWESHNTV